MTSVERISISKACCFINKKLMYLNTCINFNMIRTILLLIFILAARAEFIRDCRLEGFQDDDAPAGKNCKKLDFKLSFNEDYIGGGVCGGYAYETGMGPDDLVVAPVKECNYPNRCQIAGSLPFKCEVITFSGDREACVNYVSTATCQYDPQTAFSLAMTIAAGVLLLVSIGLVTAYVVLPRVRVNVAKTQRVRGYDLVTTANVPNGSGQRSQRFK